MTSRWNIGLKWEFRKDGWLDRHPKLFVIFPDFQFNKYSRRYSYTAHLCASFHQMYKIERDSIMNLLTNSSMGYLSKCIWTDCAENESCFDLRSEFPLDLSEMDIDD